MLVILGSWALKSSVTLSCLLAEAHGALAVVLPAAVASIRLHRASAVLAKPVLAKAIVAHQRRVGTTAVAS